MLLDGEREREGKRWSKRRERETRRRERERVGRERERQTIRDDKRWQERLNDATNNIEEIQDD